ncbi:hypothetical protein J6590_042861 [Homalodisca vitripennis]|nr:hypothetical protein J6590_042861 [Homalodisca vitripennis]
MEGLHFLPSMKTTRKVDPTLAKLAVTIKVKSRSAGNGLATRKILFGIESRGGGGLRYHHKLGREAAPSPLIARFAASAELLLVVCRDDNNYFVLNLAVTVFTRRLLAVRIFPTNDDPLCPVRMLGFILQKDFDYIKSDR